MKKEHEPKKKKIPTWLRGVFIYLLSIIIVIVAIFGIYSVAFAGQIYPRVNVAGITIGGMKPDKAKDTLTKELAEKKLAPVILVNNNKSFTVKPEEIEAKYDIEKTVEKAMAVGRGSNFFNNLVAKLTAPIFGTDLPAQVSVNKDKFNESVQNIVASVSTPQKDATLLIINGTVSIAPEVIGQVVDADVLKQQILDRFGSGQTDPVEIALIKKNPAIKQNELDQVKKQAENILATPITLTYLDKTFSAEPSTIGAWLSTKPVKTVLGTKPDLSFDDEKINAYFSDLATKIDQQAKNAKLNVVGGKVVETEASQEGRKLNKDESKKNLLKLLLVRAELPTETVTSPSPAASSSVLPDITANPTASAEPTPTISPALDSDTSKLALTVDIVKPEISSDNIASLGINERIAISTTEYKTSPANRKANIALGTKLFNGIILKPGQQFSAVKALGNIDEASGFKPELVIKEDQVIPEAGGGLCQVSTTLFRAVMNAGLQVDERRNHSFRVSYYEVRPSNPDPEDYVTLNAKTLVGLDATIYDPSPDFKFTNDTDHYLLIYGHIEDARLTFELYGTKDGRKTTIDGPYITSTTPAPTDTKYIDDPTMPTGTEKIKERAVAGAKTSVTYTVMKDGKQIHKNTFTSNYVPWKQTIFRGTAPVASPSPTPTDTATPAASPSPAQ